jgi:hypothetical protein
MIKSELVQRVAEKNLHLHRADLEKVVNAILDRIASALTQRDRVELPRRTSGLRLFNCRVADRLGERLTAVFGNLAGADVAVIDLIPVVNEPRHLLGRLLWSVSTVADAPRSSTKSMWLEEIASPPQKRTPSERMLGVAKFVASDRLLKTGRQGCRGVRCRPVGLMGDIEGAGAANTMPLRAASLGFVRFSRCSVRRGVTWVCSRTAVCTTQIL